MADNKTLYIIDLKDAFSPKLNRADKNYEKFDSKVKRGTSKSGGIGSLLSSMSPLTLGVAGLATAFGAATAKVIKMGSEMEQIRTSFGVMFGGVEKGNEMLDIMNEFANVTPFTNDQVIKAGKTLRAFGFTAESIAPTLKILGDVSAGTGKDFSEMATIFGKIKANSKLMGAELNMLVDSGFNPLQQMADRTGESYSSLFKKMSMGQISFKMVQDEFVRATSKGGLFDDMMKKQSETFGGLVSTIQGKLGALFAKSGEGLATALKPLLKWVINFIDTIPKINLSGLISSFTMWWDTTKKLLSPLTDLFSSMGEGITIGEILQTTINGIAAAFRFLSLPLRMAFKLFTDFTQKMQPVIEAFEGIGNTIKGAFTFDVASISKGINQFNSGVDKIKSGIRGVFDEEVQGFKDIFATQLKGDQKGVDLAALSDPSNLMRAGAGGAAGAGGSKKSSVSGGVAGVSSGGIKNVTINIDKLVEEITFQTTTTQDINAMKQMITRALVEAGTDATRLIGA